MTTTCDTYACQPPPASQTSTTQPSSTPAHEQDLAAIGFVGPALLLIAVCILALGFLAVTAARAGRR